MKTKMIKSKILADSLVWLGFEYEKDEQGNFIFERTNYFEKAWKDLHYLRSYYSVRNKK